MTGVRSDSATVVVSREFLIDAGLADAALIAEDDAERMATQQRWRALPWWTRAWWTVRPRLTGAKQRVSHAVRALRGMDCEE